MSIRSANKKDATDIKYLLEVLGYQTDLHLLEKQLLALEQHPDNQVYVYELDGHVAGFIAIHFLPQLAFDGELAMITYLSVAEKERRKGIAKQLEAYVTALAWKRKCDRIQLHCHTWRTLAHQFYKKQGYQEYPTYFSKRLIYAE